MIANTATIYCANNSTMQHKVNVLKFPIRTPLIFLFLNKLLVYRAGIHKMLVSIANREDPDQTASEEAV